LDAHEFFQHLADWELETIKIERQRAMATKILLGLVASSSCRNIVSPKTVLLHSIDRRDLEDPKVSCHALWIQLWIDLEIMDTIVDPIVDSISKTWI
jgi:uncharacterized membrane protein YhfC